VWVRGYLKDRQRYGAYNRLMNDLRLYNSAKLRNYLRMDLAVFEEFFAKVEPFITSRSTKFNVSVPMLCLHQLRH